MMTDNNKLPELSSDPVAEMQARAEALERQLAESQQAAQTRLIRAELKVEAVRAGIVDMDGLQLLNTTDVKLNEKGEVQNAFQLVAQLRHAKPWLFGGASSSSPASVPPAQPPRQKLATEMTDDEYRIARAALLKQCA